MWVVLINNLKKHVHDLDLDVLPQDHKFAKDAMKDGFQIVTFSGVLTVKKLKEAVDELVRDVFDDLV